MERTWVEVSKEALKHNVSVIRGLVGRGTKIMAVVKANAYGHGLIGAAKILDKHVDMLAVFTLEDGLALRKAGIKSSILIFGESIETQAKYKFPVHLKIDTGLSRQGIILADLPNFLKKVPKNIKIEGIYSHFADAENIKDRGFTLQQIANFKKAISIMSEHKIAPLITHIAATDGMIMYPEAEFDMVRAGIAIYGVPPSRDFQNKFALLGLRPALSWKTRIVQLKSIPKGATVGYGRTETVSRPTRIALLPIGYWDGYPRALSGRAYVAVGGIRCKVLGRISMNVTVIDVTAVSGVVVGDEVELIGEHVSALELAELGDILSYELITRINPWIPRNYV